MKESTKVSAVEVFPSLIFKHLWLLSLASSGTKAISVSHFYNPSCTFLSQPTCLCHTHSLSRTPSCLISLSLCITISSAVEWSIFLCICLSVSLHSPSHPILTLPENVNDVHSVRCSSHSLSDSVTSVLCMFSSRLVFFCIHLPKRT